MNKRVFIVHGWDGYPDEGWFPWLKKSLEQAGFKVFVPQLPEAANPRINNWVPALAETIKEADEQTYFVGHSLGCSTIARYLESLPDGKRVGGAVFAAGFFKRLTGLEDAPDVRETVRHWLETPIDFKKVKSHLPRSMAIFSDTDPYIPLDNQEDFRDKLGSEIIVVRDQGHFSGGRDGTRKLPVVLEKMLNL